MAGVAELNPTLRRRLNATGTVDSVPKKGKSIQEYGEKQKLNVANNNASVARQASPDREVERTTLPFAKVGDDSWPNQGSKPSVSKNGIDRFNPSKLTLGNGPDGQVGMFKDGQMQEPGSVRLSGGNLGGTPLQAGQSPFFMKSQAAQGLVPQPGTASAIPGMQQNPAVTMPGGNVTDLMNQETAMLNSILQGTKSGANFGQNFGQTPAAPGGAPQIGDRAYRDLEKNITDMRNQQKAFTSGNYSPSAFGTLSPGQRMNYAASLGEQIKGMEDTLFNRSSLANDLVKALVAAQSGENIAGTAAKAGTEQERIKAGATVEAASLNKQGDLAIAGQKRTDAEEQKKIANQINILNSRRKATQDRISGGEASPDLQKRLDEIDQSLLLLQTSLGGGDILSVMKAAGLNLD